MLAIRFNRTGKRNHASFRVVLQEHTKAPGKRHIEILGSYDPHKKTTILNKDRILYWMGQGAQASPVVTNLLIREGVIEGKKVAKKMPRPVVKEAVVPTEAGEAKVEEVPAVAKTEVKAEEITPEVAAQPAAEEVKSETVPAEVSAQAEAVAPVVEAKEEAPAAQAEPKA